MTISTKIPGSLANGVQPTVEADACISEPVRRAVASVATVRPPKDFDEVLENFKNAQSHKDKIGQLHIGFGVSVGSVNSQIDRLVFYLCTALWNNKNIVLSPKDYIKSCYDGRDKNDAPIYKTPQETRGDVGLKAYAMLCANFFNWTLRVGDYGEEFGYVWEEIVLSEKLFPVIQKFFREANGANGYTKLFNLPSDEISHNEKTVVKFIRNLSTFVWEGWKPVEIYNSMPAETKSILIERNEKLASRIIKVKLWTVEILAAFEQFDVLRRRAPKFDDGCWSKLNQIALCTALEPPKFPIAKKQLVDSIQQAAMAGSRVAEFILLFQNAMNERGKLQSRFNAEKDLEHAQLKKELFGPPEK